MRRLRIGDKTLRVRDEPEPAPDPERGPVPLVCVHGAGGSSVVWMDVVRRLPPARRVVAPDLPGHGQSERGAAPLDLEGYRDTLLGLSTHLGLSRVVLMGHSMGGAIALHCALAWPERVAGLVLVNSAARLPVSPEFLALLTAALPRAAEPGEAEAVVDRLPSELGDLFFSPATAKDVRERWQAMLLSATRQTVLEDFLACDHFAVGERLGELKLPTLVIGGQDDLLVPPRAVAATAKKIAGAELRLVPDTGHLTHLEQPETFFGLLGEFLNQNFAR
jgi:pimeloyl-ACP methyl ester carboxylesterase